LAIVEITHDYPSPKTTDRLLALLEVNPDGVTIKEIADRLNRPVSMVQICLKSLTASRQVAVKIRDDGTQITKVYIIRKSGVSYLSQKNNIVDSFESANFTPVSLRSRIGLSQQEIADALDVRISTVNGWEKGKSHPKLAPSQLKQMMLTYQCTLDELIAAFENN
jgi:DNA-binding transcriptional regulator YiaG